MILGGLGGNRYEKKNLDGMKLRKYNASKGYITLGAYTALILLNLLFKIAIIFISIYNGYRLCRWPTKDTLYEFLAPFALLIYIILDSNDVLPDIFYETAARIIFFALCLCVFIYFGFSSDIKKLIIRRRLKDKFRSLDHLENFIFYYCLAKHTPDKLNYYYELGIKPLDDNSINEILGALNAEKTMNGTGPDNNANEHGIRLQSLIEKIKETYLSPANSMATKQKGRGNLNHPGLSHRHPTPR